jgi:nickel-dependent lactate racemase
MKQVIFDFGRIRFPVFVPDHTEILKMGKVSPLAHPEEEIFSKLHNPTDCLPLPQLIKQKLSRNPKAQASIVISDNTRPIPYSGKHGILFPLIRVMLKAGFPASQINLLVATGTHHPMNEHELADFLDPRIFDLGLKVLNHDCRKPGDLIFLGRTQIGEQIDINRSYLESDLKILTGLVESHFMAGASGGRKSICPGLLAEHSTSILHGAKILSSPKASDLVLKGNPVHEEALTIAKMAGCDMIINVTLDSEYKLTGIFAGDMETAHLEAVNKLTSYAAIPVTKKYDLVITHTGFVGINHYQAAKGALVAASLLEPNGIVILAASHPDRDPIGGNDYKAIMKILGKLGSQKFLEAIQNPSWTFVPEQWEAQMWTRLFTRTPPENLMYCTFDIPEKDFTWLPGTDARSLAPQANTLPLLVETSLSKSIQRLRQSLGRELRIAVLPDGSYGIPIPQDQPNA